MSFKQILALIIFLFISSCDGCGCSSRPDCYDTCEFETNNLRDYNNCLCEVCSIGCPDTGVSSRRYEVQVDQDAACSDAGSVD